MLTKRNGHLIVQIHNAVQSQQSTEKTFEFEYPRIIFLVGLTEVYEWCSWKQPAISVFPQAKDKQLSENSGLLTEK